MEPVPMPQVLDPDRIVLPERGDITLEEHRSETEAMREQFARTAEYGQALWHTLEAVRAYLVDSLPSEPAADGAVARPTASPTGKSDDAGWQKWMEVYSAVTSSLAGSQGDSGFGMEEAVVVARHRRV